MNATTPVSQSRALDLESCWKAFESRDKRFDGRFFTTVRTTRIYCRPGCPARLPRRDNVRFVPTAAAAEEAGYRPCKRCRPDAAPGTPLWSGTTASVARALRLIEDGVLGERAALDERGVPALADRLGMTDRHLRRLFAEHLGASPAQIVRTRRVHFARRLLDETALPVTRIAYEAGFGSLRAFHTAYKESFGEPPKASRAAETPKEAGRLLTLRLPYRPPFDWNAILGFLA
ncbi:MAG: DNA-3-methyladenine glycosylase 2 family protein, partial [Acidobacteria bacterium]|nr:DNA-3-methyladenine glycosylase 2 family protein [Acidobacteriota bacterium]